MLGNTHPIVPANSFFGKTLLVEVKCLGTNGMGVSSVTVTSNWI